MKYWDEPVTNTLQGRPLLAALTVCCAIGFLLFGYDQGVMGGLIGGADFLETFPALANNSTLLGATVAIYEIGALIGSIFASVYGERLGRRRAMILGCVFALTGGAIQGGSDGPNALAILIFFRVWTGLGIGMLTSLLPAFHAECSPAKYRGSIVLLDLVACACGLTLSFWLSFATSYISGGAQWRFPLSFQAVFPLIVLIVVAFLPDSPRWLAQQGRTDEARAVLLRYNGPEEAAAVYAEIETAIAIEREAGVTRWSDAFRPGPQALRYRTFLGMGALFAQQCTGVSLEADAQLAPRADSTEIFTKSVGLSRNLSLILSGVNGINSLCFVILGTFLIDRVGRVRLMWTTAAMQAVMFAVMAGVLADGNPSYGEGVTGACMLFLFFASFSVGWLGPSWLYPSEVTPLATRAIAASLSSASNWIWNFVVVTVSPPALDGIKGKYYIVFAILNALLVPMLYFFYPETARLSLEEIDALFANGNVQMRRSPRSPVEGFVAPVAKHVVDSDKVMRGEEEQIEKV
ncbi:putative Sugar transporter STL1 (putative) [Rhodotorula toruloides]|nr:putative Sugar transporter STL1 (putative) [Rhodotorula toruloides]